MDAGRPVWDKPEQAEEPDDVSNFEALLLHRDVQKRLQSGERRIDYQYPSSD